MFGLVRQRVGRRGPAGVYPGIEVWVGSSFKPPYFPHSPPDFPYEPYPAICDHCNPHSIWECAEQIDETGCSSLKEIHRWSVDKNGTAQTLGRIKNGKKKYFWCIKGWLQITDKKIIKSIASVDEWQLVIERVRFPPYA